MLTYFASFFAGGLATLSPCVLPVIPIMVGSSSQKHKLGPVALAGGLILSFISIGFVFSAFSTLAGISEVQIRSASAWLLIVFGALLLSTTLKNSMGRISTPLANFGNTLSSRLDSFGLWGQFGIGFLLGSAWSPCVGPTLGAALGLAAIEGSRFQSVVSLSLFGVGMAIPFLAIGYGARKSFLKHRERLLLLNRYAMPILGFILFAAGILIVSGQIKAIETLVVELLPHKFFELITK